MAVMIVCGAPGSGKTTYVNKHKKAGDVIVDLDALYQAITGEPWYDKPSNLLFFVFQLRDTLYTLIRNYPDRFYTAWVITGGAKRDQRRKLASDLKARVVVLDTSPNECVLRISRDPRRADKFKLWSELVYKWWREYEPD